MARKLEFFKIGASTKIKIYPNYEYPDIYSVYVCNGNLNMSCDHNVVMIENSFPSLNILPSEVVGHESDTAEELIDYFCENLMFTESKEV